MAGRNDSIEKRLAFERSQLGPLPAHAPDLGLLAEVLVHSTGRARFQTNDYSVPIEYAYQRLTDDQPIRSACASIQVRN